jgi:hypothetical protein
MRGGGHLASEQHALSSSFVKEDAASGGGNNSSGSNVLTGGVTSPVAESKAKKSSAPSSRRGSVSSTAGATLPPISPATSPATTAFTAPTVFSRVLLHQVGDAEGSPQVAEIQLLLVETLGGRCLVMKTTASDPIEAMLSAAACSHVVVVYPSFPLRRRPAETDRKALLALSCYVELAMREKEKVAFERAQSAKASRGSGVDFPSDTDSNSSRPGTPAVAGGGRGSKITFAGAWSVVQPPPAPESGDSAAGPALNETMLPPVKSPSSAAASAAAADGGVFGAAALSPSRAQLRLPPTFAEVQGVAGLYQGLTGKKRAAGGAAGAEDKGRRRRVRQVNVIG